MSKKFLFVLFLLCALLLSSCSVQEKTDIYGFCERFNDEYGEALNASDYYLDSDGQYNIFFTLQNGCSAAASFVTDDDSSVSLVQLTVTESEFENAEGSSQALFECFSVMCRVLLSLTDQELSADFGNAGFSAESPALSPSDISFEVTGGKISVFMNEKMISMYCEKQ